MPIECYSLLSRWAGLTRAADSPGSAAMATASPSEIGIRTANHGRGMSGTGTMPRWRAKISHAPRPHTAPAGMPMASAAAVSVAACQAVVRRTWPRVNPRVRRMAKAARYHCGEEMATARAGPARITGWLPAWLSKSEGGYAAQASDELRGCKRSKITYEDHNMPLTCRNVELRGFEPLTSCMPSAGSTSARVHLPTSPSRDVRTSPPESGPVAVLSCCTALSPRRCALRPTRDQSNPFGFTALATGTTHAIGIARPASPAVTAGAQMGADRYAARIGRSIPPERRRAGSLLVLAAGLSMPDAARGELPAVDLAAVPGVEDRKSVV